MINRICYSHNNLITVIITPADLITLSPIITLITFATVTSVIHVMCRYYTPFNPQEDVSLVINMLMSVHVTLTYQSATTIALIWQCFHTNLTVLSATWQCFYTNITALSALYHKVCLNATTGRRKWSVPIHLPLKTRVNPSSPLINPRWPNVFQKALSSCALNVSTFYSQFN